MKEIFSLNLIELINDFENIRKDIMPNQLKKSLRKAKGVFKGRLPAVNEFKRIGNISYENMQAVFDYNEPVFKQIEELRDNICFFEEFIDYTEATSICESEKNERIDFAKDGIMKTHRIIAIYKAIILVAN